MKEKKITISDVARTAGVSKSTVSNYLNKRYDRMKEETKDKIQAAIDHLDYVPSISAQIIGQGKKQNNRVNYSGESGKYI